jgi:hypothetical protein
LKKAWRLFFGPKVVLVAVKDDFPHHPFYTSAGDKARRLAEIARQRNALKDELAKVIKAKKARAPIYAALRALSIEELKVEGRR